MQEGAQFFGRKSLKTPANKGVCVFQRWQSRKSNSWVGTLRFSYPTQQYVSDTAKLRCNVHHYRCTTIRAPFDPYQKLLRFTSLALDQIQLVPI